MLEQLPLGYLSSAHYECRGVLRTPICTMRPLLEPDGRCRALLGWKGCMHATIRVFCSWRAVSYEVKVQDIFIRGTLLHYDRAPR